MKNVLQTRNNFGARCDQADKRELITKINQFLGLMNRPETEVYANDPYFMDGPKLDKNGKIIDKTGQIIEKIQLCIIFEMLLRHYSQSGNSKWFFSPEEANEMDVLHLAVYRRIINGKNVFELR